MNPIKITLSKGLMALCFMACSLTVNAIELINWDKAPIKMRIHQGDERMVILEKNISVGLPVTLQDKLRVQSLGGVLYLKSSTTFPETRLMLKDLETGEIILLDVTGESPSKKKLETIKIVTGENSQSTDGNDDFSIIGNAPATINKQTLPVPVLLTRYAAQNYYAPLRAIEKVPGIKSVSMSLPAQLTRLAPQYPIIAMPQSIWRLKGYDVVAIKLVNQSENSISFDARLLQGEFYSATFQHNTLGPKGQSTDTTMLYIVTKGKAINAFLTEPTLLEHVNNKKGGENGKN